MPDQTPGVLGSVLIASSEDGISDTIVPRLKAADADLTKIQLLDGVKEFDGSRPLSVPADLAPVRKKIQELNACLLILDPLMAFLGAGIDSCKDQDVRRCLHALRDVAEQERCTILFLRHLNKSPGGKAMYRGGGSIGIIGAARAGLLVAKDPEDEKSRILACTKSNLADPPPSLRFSLEPTHYQVCRTAWNGIANYDADELLGGESEPEEEETKQAADEFLLNALAHGQRLATEIFANGKEHGFSRDVLYRAKKRLQID